MAMDKFREKLTALREEAESFIAKAEENEGKLKIAKASQQERDQEILNLKSRVTLLKMEHLKIGKRAEEHKALAGNEEAAEDADQLNDVINETEAQIEESKLKLSETLESIRQSDIKAEQLEKTLYRLEQDINQWEAKNKTLNETLEATKKEHQETLALLDEI